MRRIRVHKVVATRSLRTSAGDVFCGLSASLQMDGAGAGVDLVPEVDEDPSSEVQAGMTLDEVKMTYLILQHKAYLMCIQSALATGGIDPSRASHLIKEASEAFAKALSKSASGVQHAQSSNGG